MLSVALAAAIAGGALAWALSGTPSSRTVALSAPCPATSVYYCTQIADQAYAPLQNVYGQAMPYAVGTHCGGPEKSLRLGVLYARSSKGALVLAGNWLAVATKKLITLGCRRVPNTGTFEQREARAGRTLNALTYYIGVGTRALGVIAVQTSSGG